MYLVELASDGLIKIDTYGTGWFGIKALREVYEKHGREGITVVALTCDYISPFKFYQKEEERFIRSVDEIYGSKTKLKKTKLIKDAIDKYNELQYNIDLEQNRINDSITYRLLDKIKQSNREDDDAAISKFNKLLQSHEASSGNFKKRFDKQKAYEKSVTENGYELTRIEIDIKNSKRSKFVKHGKDLENPNKLGLQN